MSTDTHARAHAETHDKFKPETCTLACTEKMMKIVEKLHNKVRILSRTLGKVTIT